MPSKPVAIIMGSQSDWATMKHAAETLDALKIGYDARIVSAHRTPKRLYDFAHSARDNGWLAFLTYGEGYHNFHHQFAHDYRNGVRWWQWDPSKWIICSLSWVGLTRKLRRTPAVVIQRARLAMHEGDAIGESRLGGPKPRRLDHRRLDIEAGGMGGMMGSGQMQRNAAGAAAQVKHALSLERQPGQHAVDLFRTAGRQIPLAPQRLQEADGLVVIFGCGIDHTIEAPTREWLGQT